MSEDQFLAELELVRRRGFALNLASNQPDVHAVGADDKVTLGRRAVGEMGDDRLVGAMRATLAR